MVDENRNINKKEEDKCDSEAKAKWKCPPIRNVTHPLRYYEFTEEEMKALEECDKESFYQRCLPLSTLFGALTYAGVKRGVLRTSPHFGAVPKVFLASFIGYCYGRISYVSECDLKLRQLPPSSYLGNLMRKYHMQNNLPESK